MMLKSIASANENAKRRDKGCNQAGKKETNKLLKAKTKLKKNQTLYCMKTDTISNHSSEIHLLENQCRVRHLYILICRWVAAWECIKNL